MILWEYLPYLGAQTILALLAVWFLRLVSIPQFIRVVMVVSVLTVPFAVMRTGVGSALYVGDVLLPFVLLAVGLRQPKILRYGLKIPEAWALAFATVGFPLLLTCFLVVAEAYRFTGADYLYLYRHALYVAIFVFCAGVPLRPGELSGFMKLTVALVASLGCVGVLHYFGPWDFNIFDQLRWGWLPSMDPPRFGTGFFGLFRGSVGHYFALGSILSVSLLIAGKGKVYSLGFLGLIVALLVLLASFSRAGLLGLIVGLVVFSLCASIKGKLKLAAAVAAAIGVVFWVVATFEAEDSFKSRYQLSFDRMTSEDEAIKNRLDAWTLSIDHFYRNPRLLLTGIGLRNESVFFLTGLYGAHDDYLQSIFKGGLCSLGSLVLFLFLAISRFARAASQAGREMRIFALTGLSLIVTNAVIAIPQGAFIASHATHTVTLFNYALMGTLLGGIAICDDVGGMRREVCVPRSGSPRTIANGTAFQGGP